MVRFSFDVMGLNFSPYKPGLLFWWRAKHKPYDSLYRCNTCRCLESSTSKFVFCTSSPGSVQDWHKGLYWFERNVPTSSMWLLVLLVLVCSKGYKRSRKGDWSQVSGVLNVVWSVVAILRVRSPVSRVWRFVLHLGGLPFSL